MPVVVVVKDDVSCGIRELCRQPRTDPVEAKHCRRVQVPVSTAGCTAPTAPLIGTPEMQQSELRSRAVSLMPGRSNRGGLPLVNFDANAAPLASTSAICRDNTAATPRRPVCVRRRAYELNCETGRLDSRRTQESYHLRRALTTITRRIAEVDEVRVRPVNGQYARTTPEHNGSMAMLKGDAAFATIDTLTGLARTGKLRRSSPEPRTRRDDRHALVHRAHPHGPDRTTLINGACSRAGSERRTSRRRPD